MVIVALHDLELAMRYNQALVLLDAGRVIASGPLETVLDRENIGKVYRVDVDVVRSAAGRMLVQLNRPIAQGSSHE